MPFNVQAAITLSLLAVAYAAPSKLEARASGVVTTCKKSGTYALTFDDGPYNYHSQFADYLTDNGAVGTFFINGNNYDCAYDQKYSSMVQKSFHDGHIIASHTWNHIDLNTASDSEINQTLDLMETYFRKVLGVKPKLFRPPYGNINDNALKILKSRGYAVITWSFDSGDSVGASTSSSISGYKKEAAKYPTPGIGLNHETIKGSLTVLHSSVKALQNKGYKLVSVSECLGVPAYEVIGKPGKRDSTWTCAGTPSG